MKPLSIEKSGRLHIDILAKTGALSPCCRQSIVALSNAGIYRHAIAMIVHCSISSVRRWIQRVKETGSVCDLARSGRPAIYSQEMKMRLVAFYCQTQPLPGCGRWTLRWAELRLKAEPAQVGAAPGKSTLHRILQQNQLKPHQSRYFLNITDPDFFPKMEHLLALYRQPPENLFFFDECPGIQILKRLTPDMQSDSMCKRLEEFEYIRNGTMDVLAFLTHADGKVHLACCSDHKTTTLLKVFREHVNQYPATETLHYVMDNLSTHRGYPLCQLVAELSEVACPSQDKLSTVEKRVAWLGQEDKRIVIHYTPYHGSWLNWIEFWFGIMGRKVLTESFGSAQEIKAALEAFVADWNTLLAHPFQWSYDGSGLHEKAVTRFTQMLSHSASKMDVRILTKQMMLLTNLLNDYLSEISHDSWSRFHTVFLAQTANINALIQHEEGKIRKTKAEQAFNNLADTFLQYFPSSESAQLEDIKQPI